MSYNTALSQQKEDHSLILIHNTDCNISSYRHFPIQCRSYLTLTLAPSHLNLDTILSLRSLHFYPLHVNHFHPPPSPLFLTTLFSLSPFSHFLLPIQSRSFLTLTISPSHLKLNTTPSSPSSLPFYPIHVNHSHHLPSPFLLTLVQLSFLLSLSFVYAKLLPIPLRLATHSLQAPLLLI